MEAGAPRTAYETYIAAALVVGIVVGLVALTLFVSQVAVGLRLGEFGDETEKFVAAQMLWKGHHLYRDVYAAHGPVPYMIAHFYTALISCSDFSYIRLLEGALALMSGSALMLSPIFKSTAPRVWAGGLYLLALSSVWTSLWMHMVLYQSISGFLAVILLSQLVVPIFFSQRTKSAGLVISGVCAALICFSAYSFAPVTVLLFISCVVVALPSLTKTEILRCSKLVALGVLAGVGAVLFWLWRFGDMEGYVVYHIYSMQKFYAPFINYSPWLFLKNITFSFAPEAIVHSLALISLAASLNIFLTQRSRAASSGGLISRVSAIALIAIAVLMINPRADFWFPDSPFVITSLALLSIAAGLVLQNALTAPDRRGFSQFAILTVAVSGVALHVKSYASPNGTTADAMQKYVVDMRPHTGGIYGFIRSIAKKDGDILSLVYEPAIYIKVGRLPASGNYYYLPWQAAYNRSPVGGYRIAICTDIASRKPAVIWLFNWRVWNKYAIEDYEPCVLSLISEGYAPLAFNSPWYIRRDLLSANVGSPPLDAEASEWLEQTLRSSYPLASFSPIRLSMTPGHQGNPASLRRVGVLMRTYARRNAGEAELRLKDMNGTAFLQRFALSDIVDNAYHYFDLKAARYSSGEIVSVTGEGISTWESHPENGDTYSCLVYDYSDGRRRFTTGCPLM